MKKLLLLSITVLAISCTPRTDRNTEGIPEEKILFSGFYEILNDSVAKHKGEQWLFKKKKANDGTFRYYYIR